MEIIKNLKT